jgi:MoaA/NifB/PqqE/SkfB family radical SAM enzyme
MAGGTGECCARAANCSRCQPEGPAVNLLLIITARCNASCAHCSQSYGPDRAEALDRDDIFRLMDEAAEIDDGKPLEFDITGGEPFMDFDLLVEVIRHGAELGGDVSCTSNGYWARSPAIALAKLAMLRRAGLRRLAVSVSRFHQEFVPLERARCALEAAVRLGLHTELKGALTNTDLKAGSIEQWKSAGLRASFINMFPVLPELREGERLADEDYYRVPGLPADRCPGAIVAIDFNGRAMSCCAPKSNDDFLSIGNAHTMSLADIHRNFHERGQQRVLHEHGPARFARAAIDAGLGHLLRDSYAGPCDLCLHIRTEPSLRKVANALATSIEKPKQKRRGEKHVKNIPG